MRGLVRSPGKQRPGGDFCAGRFGSACKAQGRMQGWTVCLSRAGCVPDTSEPSVNMLEKHKWDLTSPSTRGKRQQNFISPMKRGEREKRKAITRKHKKQETQNSSQTEMRRTQESVRERWRCGHFILLLFERAQHSHYLIFGRFRSTRYLPPSSSGPVLLCSSHEHW